MTPEQAKQAMESNKGVTPTHQPREYSHGYITCLSDDETLAYFLIHGVPGYYGYAQVQDLTLAWPWCNQD